MTASTGELQAEHVDDCAPRPAQILLAAERPASTAASGFTQTEPSARADSDLCTLLLAVYSRPKQEPVIRLPERRQSRSQNRAPKSAASARFLAGDLLPGGPIRTRTTSTSRRLSSKRHCTQRLR